MVIPFTMDFGWHYFFKTSHFGKSPVDVTSITKSHQLVPRPEVGSEVPKHPVAKDV